MAFPKDFLWGAATSSYQIEGAALEDGRGECIWHRFSHTPGKVMNNDNGDRACDHYHLYADDVKLMKELGLQAYRFSVSWPRVIPQGTGAANPAGLDFYDRLVDELLAANIIPYLTLYHWDLPQALQDRGGWENPAIIQWFSEYTDLMTRRLGDRVKYWATHNEPWVAAFLGHHIGIHAPGKTSWPAAFKAAHHLLLSHGAAIPIIRQNVPDSYAGIVLDQAERTPASDDPADIEAAHLSGVAGGHRWFLDPLFRGHYPADGVRHLEAELKDIDLDAVQAACVPIDFLGINYYMRLVFAANEDGKPFPPRIIPQPNAPMTQMEWEVFPDGLYNLLTDIHQNYGPIDLYVTENGAAYPDPAPVNGVIEDPERAAYLQQHFAAAERAIADGVSLKGYFVWSFLDNFEWAYGYDRRFGIVHVDFDSLVRTPKRSALWYKDWIAAHTSA